MSSVAASFAQPKTRTFVITQKSSDEHGPNLFYESDFDTWYNANGPSKITKVSPSMYIIPGTGDLSFENVIKGGVDNTELGGGGTNYINGRRSLIDLGKEITIGTSGESRMLVLRKVRVNGPDAKGGDSGNVGYVITENNSNELSGNDVGRFTIGVARV